MSALGLRLLRRWHRRSCPGCSSCGSLHRSLIDHRTRLFNVAGVRKNQGVDAVSVAPWAAAALSAISAVIAARQAGHAKDAAGGALRQAESAHRQALVAEEDLLLRKLEIQTGGDRERALHMLAGRDLAMEYLTAAREFLALLARSTRWGFPNNAAEARLQRLWVLLMFHRNRYKAAEVEEDAVLQLIDQTENDIQAMELDGWLVSPFSIDGINTKHLHVLARVALFHLDNLLADSRRFDRWERVRPRSEEE